MDREEKRFWAAALILAGLSANYHQGLIPCNYWVSCAVELADYLLKILSEKPEKYQNKENGEKYQNNPVKHF